MLYKDKILIMYDCILDELNQGCELNQCLLEIEDSLQIAVDQVTEVHEALSQAKDRVKTSERELTIQMLKNLELRKETDRI